MLKYTGSFGTVATLLEMIPFVGIFFSFTNTGVSLHIRHKQGCSTKLIPLKVGAALWAADIEAKNTAMLNTTAPELRDAAQNAE